MGDRANVHIKEDSGPGIYLYTHWGGEGLPELVREVVSRQQRWDDPPYLVGMIFSAMTKDCLNSETGYGISTRILDYNHPLIVVDCRKREVRFEAIEMSRAERVVEAMRDSDRKVLGRLTFDQIVKTKQLGWPDRADKASSEQQRHLGDCRKREVRF
jgi:hypothetical protein